MKTKYLNKKARIAYLQIFMLILNLFAFSYLIYSSMEVVSAQDEKVHCCVDTCRDISDSETENCKQVQRNTACDEIDECQKGCCYDEINGVCSSNVYKNSCSGEFDLNDKDCESSKCEEGCCELDSGNSWVIESYCNLLSSDKGVDMKFGFKDKEECLGEDNSQELGACVLVGNKCDFTTQENCENRKGEFHLNYLCSNSELNTDCVKQSYINCVEGKDEIYWFDSCGNRENIYSANKFRSWNGGKVLSKENSCGSDSANTDSTSCGNCNSGAGSICKRYNSLTDENPVEDGDFVCGDLNCKIKINGKDVVKENGESWCVYESKIGTSSEDDNAYAMETVGSRHYRFECDNGIVKSNVCKIEEVCSESESNRKTEAVCAVNDWESCMDDTNNGGDDEEELKECNDNVFCFVKEFKVNDNFKVSACLPKYPPKFKFIQKGENWIASSEDYCDLATITCQGSNCLAPETIKKMNEFCISLGDCGAYVNVNGEFEGDGFMRNTKSFDELVGNSRLKSVLGSMVQDYENNNKVEHGKKIDTKEIQSDYERRGILQITEGEVNGVGGEEKKGGIFGNFNNFMPLILGAAATIAGFFLAGPTGAIVGVVIGVIAMLLSNRGEEEEEQPNTPVEFKCLPWQPPFGGDDCHLCNEGLKNINGDLLMPCTDYKCRSLGQACQIFNEGTNFEMCEAVPDNNEDPVISFSEDELGEGFSSKEFELGIKVIGPKNNCVPVFQNFTLGIKTNEPTQCKYTYGKMKGEGRPFGSNYLLYNHTLDFYFPSSALLAHTYDFSLGEINTIYQDINMHITCTDNYGHSDELVVQMCVSQEDNEEPEINKMLPEDDGYVKFGASEQDAVFWINEPAECKWDTSGTLDYDDMPVENKMNCSTDLIPAIGVLSALSGWPCETTLPISEGENVFYIKCKDQPWELEDESVKNEMKNAKSYTLHSSEYELSIEDVSLKDEEGNVGNDFSMGGKIMNLNLEVKTFGGASKGESKCEYNLGYGFFPFSSDKGSLHTNQFRFSEGEYNMNISCNDVGGNVANSSVSFKVNLDNVGPIVVRAYEDRYNLKIITNEAATCKYLVGDVWKNITSSLSEVHTLRWIEGKVYEIKCTDKFGIEGNVIVVKPIVEGRGF